MRYGKIALPEELEFSYASAEIEELNQAALKHEAADICALSFHAYAYVADQYQILRSGASMAGKNYGPRLVAKSVILSEAKGSLTPRNDRLRIAIPGKLTSAYLVLQIYYKQLGIEFTPIFCKFDEVFDLLERGEVDASLLIHESQLKYQELGYSLLVDLGAWWHQMSGGLSMPLGCNAIRRDLPQKNKLAKLMHDSIKWGLANLDETLDYARKFAANELDDAKAREYISMYVNAQTLRLSDDDTKSIELMYELAANFKLLANKNINIKPV